MISIEQIAPEATWRLRRQVLYPEKEIREMEMDVDRNGYHFGAFADNKLVGVVSLFQDGTAFQFRKLAVDPAFQRRGAGTALLNYITGFVIQNGGTRIWCNARITAAGFYLKSGYYGSGNTFTKNGHQYEVMDKSIPPSDSL